MDACSVPDCGRPILARGWCRSHYKRWSKYGDPLAGGKARPGFWGHVDKSPGGCWIWTGTQDAKGYGISGKGDGRYSKYAHRRSWQMTRGEVPEGLELDHLCRNPSCVNPDHLEPVTHQVNVARGLHGRERTHCPHGHPYDEANSYVYKGRTHCRACNREASRRYNAERRRKR
jgi:hypothetical protein